MSFIYEVIINRKHSGLKNRASTPHRVKMYVCMYVCMYVRTYVYVCVRVCLYVCVCVLLCLRITPSLRVAGKEVKFHVFLTWALAECGQLHTSAIAILAIQHLYSLSELKFWTKMRKRITAFWVSSGVCTVVTLSDPHIGSRYHSMRHHRSSDGRYGFQIWRVLNKQWRTAVRGWYSSFGVGKRAKNYSP
jgi:hypothetical protein